MTDIHGSNRVDPSQRVRLSVAWGAWALVCTGLAILFDLAAGPYLICLLVAEAMLAWRSYRATGSRYFLALCFLPALPILVVALSTPFTPELLRLMSLTIPPLVAVGVVAVLADDRIRGRRGFRRFLAVAVVGTIGLGVHNVLRSLGAPALDTPAGRALVARSPLACSPCTCTASSVRKCVRRWQGRLAVTPRACRTDRPRFMCARRPDRRPGAKDRWKTRRVMPNQ